MTKSTKKTFPQHKNNIHESGGEFVTAYGDNKFYRGKGRKSDRNVDTWEDRKQEAYLKALEEARAKKKW
jgi:hypothetical protein